MCPALLYYLAQTWAADRYRQSQHGKPARAASGARHPPSSWRDRVRGLPGFVARRMLTTLGGGSP
jgi:hypothetical protein